MRWHYPLDTVPFCPLNIVPFCPTVGAIFLPHRSLEHTGECSQSWRKENPFSICFYLRYCFIYPSGGQSIEVAASASVLPKNCQDWSPLGWTGWISLQSKGLSRVFSSTTVWRCPTPWQPHGLQPAGLLCPWDLPGKNTGVGCHFLLQGIFPTQRWNPSLLHCRQILYHLSYQGARENVFWDV